MNPPASDALKDRYPGLRSFSHDEQHLFFGRKKEADDLLDLVRAEQITVLFAKSGLGKSSLLNAGLRPKLEAMHYRVIPIRFQQQKVQATDTDSTDQPAPLTTNPLLNIVLTQLHGEFQAAWQGQTPPGNFRQFYDPDQEPRQLWEEIKTHPFPNGAVPVFIFDQFEELFIYKQSEQNEFIGPLGELMNDQSPARIMRWLLKTDVDDRTMEMMDWSKQPLVKCLFSIRADRLFEMHKLKALIPMILRNRYELLPLSDDRAREAIDRPAQAEGEFTTPKFIYQEATREAILTSLSGTKGSATTDDEICEIESSQLQIVCNYIENKIKEKVARGEDPIVGPDIINNKKSIDRIIEKFYRQQLRQIGTTQEIKKVRLILENDLLVDGHRVGLAAMKMRKSLGDDATADRLIDKLIEVRLIRADDTHLGRTYELSHDTLIEPVEKVKRLVAIWQSRNDLRIAKEEQERNKRDQELKLAREEKQRRRFQSLSLKLAFTVIFAILSSLTAIYFLVHGRMNLAQANSDWAADEYNAGNQRMAYRLWESSRGLVRWIPFFPNARVDHRADSAYRFAPFSGATTQFTLQDDSIQYVVRLFHNNMFDLWRSDPTKATFENIDSFYKSKDTLQDGNALQINALSATSLQLQQTYLAVFTHDSLLQVFDLKTRVKVFPKEQAYYSLRTGNRALQDGGAAPYPLKTVLLAPSGDKLAVLDSNGHTQLFDLKAGEQLDTAFEKLFSTKTTVSPNDLQFSPNSNYLLIRLPGENRYQRFNLTTHQLDATYDQTSYARFSPSGRYLLTVNSSNKLTISDLQTKTSRPPVQLPADVRPDGLTFNRNESAVLASSRAASSASYTLYSIDLRQQTPSVNPIATDVSTYQVGADNVLYGTRTGSQKGMFYLYNLTTGQRTGVTSSLADRSTRFVFYTQRNPSNKSLLEDRKLIQATAQNLTIFDVSDMTKGGNVTGRLLSNQIGTSFNPNSLTISGPVVSLKNLDDIQLGFFVTDSHNQLSYIVDHIYPPLSKGDRDAAGLPAK